MRAVPFMLRQDVPSGLGPVSAFRSLGSGARHSDVHVAVAESIGVQKTRLLMSRSRVPLCLLLLVACLAATRASAQTVATGSAASSVDR
jgi:hypothetical protein